MPIGNQLYYLIGKTIRILADNLRIDNLNLRVVLS